MIRIVLDTNVIVSALVFGGLPRSVVQFVQAGRCELFYSEAIQNEVSRVLAEKFGWSPTVLNRVLPILRRGGKKVRPQIRIHAVNDDPDDDRVLECAVEARADYIVSGDRHLLALERYEAIRIVSPRQFVQLQAE